MEYSVQFSSQNDKVSTDVNVQGGKTFALHLFKTGQTLEATMQSNEQELDASFSSMQVVGGGGSDGFSPIVDVEPIEGGHRLTITDAQGTETADIMDGQDGISPVVSVEDIDGGHRVTITDKDGEKTFDVMDGKDGTGGSGGEAVQSDWAVSDESDPAFVKNRTHYEYAEFGPVKISGGYLVENGQYQEVPKCDLSMAGLGVFLKIGSDNLPREQMERITVRSDYINPDTMQSYLGRGSVEYNSEITSQVGLDVYEWIASDASIGEDFAKGYFVYFPSPVDLGISQVPEAGLYVSCKPIRASTTFVIETIVPIDMKFVPSKIVIQSFDITAFDLDEGTTDDILASKDLVNAMKSETPIRITFRFKGVRAEATFSTYSSEENTLFGAVSYFEEGGQFFMIRLSIKNEASNCSACVMAI